MKKEIGGFLELESYDLPMMHGKALDLNTGRNCLAFLIKKKKKKKIWIPIFSCNAIKTTCLKEGTEIKWYAIDEHFQPLIKDLKKDEWLYVINFFGQLDDDCLRKLKERYQRVIFDQAHAYYQKPVKDCDNIYTCRKFFGVPDGAFLYTDHNSGLRLKRAESRNSIDYLLGRYEKSAKEYYNAYLEHEKELEYETIKRMSLLTKNLLHAIDYEKVRNVRNSNYQYLREQFNKYNIIDACEADGPYMYPLMIEGAHELRQKLIKQNIFIPLLWPRVVEEANPNTWDYKMAAEVLPLPVDQRYNYKDMKYLVAVISKLGGLK